MGNLHSTTETKHIHSPNWFQDVKMAIRKHPICRLFMQTMACSLARPPSSPLRNKMIKMRRAWIRYGPYNGMQRNNDRIQMMNFHTIHTHEPSPTPGWRCWRCDHVTHQREGQFDVFLCRRLWLVLSHTSLPNASETATAVGSLWPVPSQMMDN